MAGGTNDVVHPLIVSFPGSGGMLSVSARCVFKHDFLMHPMASSLCA